MKTIKGYEYKDLSPLVRKKGRERTINEEVEFELDNLGDDLENGDISKEEYYSTIGCTEYYAETTPWFVPAVYYNQNKKKVDKEVRKLLKRRLFTQEGRFIQTI